MCVCPHAALQVPVFCFFVCLGEKKNARGDKQTHLTLCPHGNQGTQQKRDGGKDMKPGRWDANRCSGMESEEE